MIPYHSPKNSGFVDQSEFKTNDQYGFDSLKFTNDALDVVKMYIDIVHPLCQPKCEFVLVTVQSAMNGHWYSLTWRKFLLGLELSSCRDF